MTTPTDCFYYLVSRATRVATAALHRGLREAGVAHVRPAYLGVLMTLWEQEGLRSAVLGRRAGLEPSSMTGLLDRMQRDALIRREADPDDRRAQRIHLTDEGRAVEQPVLAAVDRMLSRVTAGIEPADLEVTKSTLRELLDRARGERG